MVDQQKFHHALAALLRQRRIRAHAHSFSHILGAGNLRTWHPIDDRFAIGTELRFTVRADPRHSHLDQTHSAIAGRTEFFVITIARHVGAYLRARFDHARALRKLIPRAIDLDVEHW